MDFYGNVLGLPRSSMWQRPGEEPVGAEFETGTVTVALIASERLGIAFQPNKVPIALHVEDVEAARAELESRGVSFNGDTIDSGVCYQALFEDPDGNALDLTTATRHARLKPDSQAAPGARATPRAGDHVGALVDERSGGGQPDLYWLPSRRRLCRRARGPSLLLADRVWISGPRAWRSSSRAHARGRRA